MLLMMSILDLRTSEQYPFLTRLFIFSPPMWGVGGVQRLVLSAHLVRPVRSRQDSEHLGPVLSLCHFFLWLFPPFLFPLPPFLLLSASLAPGDTSRGPGQRRPALITRELAPPLHAALGVSGSVCLPPLVSPGFPLSPLPLPSSLSFRRWLAVEIVVDPGKI